MDDGPRKTVLESEINPVNSFLLASRDMDHP
ncbi:hypothetical protein CCACVL1_09062 [Corchorus capsularis]|uniref:Uncharacterized protein n=1 Tax=Corchorus capsularis TaxID=210143 RepID=A0A1R3IXV0_COCAP|nr:hypothetical protein CCACVL1_09062 [Corchorus capsularis]